MTGPTGPTGPTAPYPGDGQVPAAATPGADPTESAGRRRGRVVRVLDGLAGLLSAGILLVGVLLALAALIAPAALSAAGLGAATGPGWQRVAAHLLVGVSGELVVHLRRRWPPTVRGGVDLAVIVAALVVIGWAWWP